MNFGGKRDFFNKYHRRQKNIIEGDAGNPGPGYVRSEPPTDRRYGRNNNTETSHRQKCQDWLYKTSEVSIDFNPLKYIDFLCSTRCWQHSWFHLRFILPNLRVTHIYSREIIALHSHLNWNLDCNHGSTRSFLDYKELVVLEESTWGT
jgi:hypothetical protein